MLLHIWQYREFISSCVKREFQARYKGSIFGVLWSVFQSLAMIFVYTVIFSNIMRAKITGMETNVYAYSIYLCAGTLTWNFFCETLTNCTNVFLANGNLLKKVAFPRICLPVITTCSALLNFIIGFFLFLIFMLIIGGFPWHSWWAIFLLLFVQAAFAVSLGIGLGVLNVFFRDVGQTLAVILQFWFWFTPIVYPEKIIPEELAWLLSYNPLYHIIRGYQDIFLYDTITTLPGVGMVFLVSILCGWWSLRLYRNHIGEIVDEL